MKTELYEDIAETFRRNGSIKKTAEELGTYPIKVRRVLLTEGLWSSRTSRAIETYRKQGMTTAQIAQLLSVSEKAVQQLIPYSRGEYLQKARSDDAVRADAYRKRMQASEEKQIFVNKEKKAIGGIRMEKKARVLLLHLELPTDRDIMPVLRRYGKVNKGITRDILVPADMTLHALHYTIQKAFGWQNSHLHNFKLPQEVFDGITGKTTSGWEEFCGLYFNSPDGENMDRYWDDDYQEGKSFKNWLKSKYTGPYYYWGSSELLLEEKLAARELITSYKKSRKKEPELRDLFNYTMQAPEELLERLPVSEVLFPAGENADRKKLEKLKKKAADIYNRYVDDYEVLRGEMEEVEDRFLEDPFAEDDYDLSIWANEVDKEFTRIVKKTNLKVTPITDRLDYSYDYGDGWEIAVTCLDSYCCAEEAEDGVRKKDWSAQKFLNRSGEEAEGNRKGQIITVLTEWKPLCIKADGLPVMDDVGGIYGYCNFLQVINSEEQGDPFESPEEALQWGKMQGWTGRMSKPEKML